MADEQTRITGDQPVSGDPKGHLCEWPHADGEDRPANHALPIMRRMKGGRGARVPTGQHVYCCDEHLELAQSQNQVRPSLKKG
jgi:hypothetical protein